jgi:hypothetical protein
VSKGSWGWLWNDTLLTCRSEETQRIDTAAILDGKWYVLLIVPLELALIREGHLV